MTFGRGPVILLLAGIWPTLPACVSLPDYPKDWPAVTPVKPGDCPAIEGTFEDKPVAFSRGSQTQGTNSLSAFLLRYKQDRTYLQVDRVHLSSQEAQISVIAYDPDNKEAQRQVLKTEPRCEQLVKVVTDSSFEIDKNLIAFGSKEWVGLGLATDGSLVLETHYSGGGEALLIPFAIVRRGWVRYRPSLPSAESNKQGTAAEAATR
jgi:hypothetical protein